MRKLKHKEEMPCLKSNQEEGILGRFDSWDQACSYHQCACLITPTFWHPLQLCLAVGFPPTLSSGFIHAHSGASGRHSHCHLQCHILYNFDPLWATTVLSTYLFLNSYILIKFLFMSVSSTRVGIYWEMKWNCIHRFYLEFGVVLKLH